MLQNSEEFIDLDLTKIAKVLKKLDAVLKYNGASKSIESREDAMPVDNDNIQDYFKEYTLIVFYHHVEKRILEAIRYIIGNDMSGLKKEKYAKGIKQNLVDEFNDESDDKIEKELISPKAEKLSKSNRLHDVNVELLYEFRNFKIARDRVAHDKLIIDYRDPPKAHEDVSWNRIKGKNLIKSDIVEVAEEVTYIMIEKYLVFAFEKVPGNKVKILDVESKAKKIEEKVKKLKSKYKKT